MPTLTHEAALILPSEPYWEPAVCQPVNLPVAAKRYLCAVEPAYAARLSAASVQSLALQGELVNSYFGVLPPSLDDDVNDWFVSQCGLSL